MHTQAYIYALSSHRLLLMRNSIRSMRKNIWYKHYHQTVEKIQKNFLFKGNAKFKWTSTFSNTLLEHSLLPLPFFILVLETPITNQTGDSLKGRVRGAIERHKGYFKGLSTIYVRDCSLSVFDLSLNLAPINSCFFLFCMFAFYSIFCCCCFPDTM